MNWVMVHDHHPTIAMFKGTVRQKSWNSKSQANLLECTGYAGVLQHSVHPAETRLLKVFPGVQKLRAS